jgi:hypothetical protein
MVFVIVLCCVQVSVAPVRQAASRSFMGFKQVRAAQLPVRGIELPPVPPPLVPPAEEVPPFGAMPPVEEVPLVEEVPPVEEVPLVEEVPPIGRIPPVLEAPPMESVVPPKKLVAPPTEVAPAMELVVPPGKLVAPPSLSLTIRPPVPPALPSGAL